MLLDRGQQCRAALLGWYRYSLTAWKRVSERDVLGVCSCGGEIEWVSAQQHECHSGFSPHSLPVADDRSLPGQLQWEAAERGDWGALHWLGPERAPAATRGCVQSCEVGLPRSWEQKCSSAPSVSVLAGCPAYRSPGQCSLRAKHQHLAVQQCFKMQRSHVFPVWSPSGGAPGWWLRRH